MLRACQALVTIVGPLLHGIAAYTGLTLSLLCGKPPDKPGDQFLIKIINSGTSAGPNGVDFSHWEPEKFQDVVIRHFMKFLLATSGISSFSSCSHLVVLTHCSLLDSAVPIDGDILLDPAAAVAMTLSPLEHTPTATPGPSKVRPKPAPRRSTALPPADVEQSRPTTPYFSPSPSPPPELATPLRLRLDALTPKAKKKERRRLDKMGDYEIGREANVARNEQLADELGVTGKGSLVEKAGDKRRREEAVKKVAQELRRETKEKKAAAAALSGPPLRHQSGRLQPAGTTSTPAPTPTCLQGAVPAQASPAKEPVLAIDKATSVMDPSPALASVPPSASPPSSIVTPVPDPTLPGSPIIPSIPASLLAHRPFTGKDLESFSLLANTEGWPTWMQTYYSYLSNTEWGTPWATTITAWGALEQNYKFIIPVSLSRSCGMIFANKRRF